MDERTRLSLLIDESDDPVALQRLAIEAASLGQRAMQFKAVTRANALRAGARAVAPPRSSRNDAPPLYRQRLSDDAFAALQVEVAAALAGGRIDRGDAPARFVLWAAEWFRRCYRGGGHEWDALLRALGGRADHATMRHVAERGLAAWGRPVRRGGHGREFLGSLAREGGFPVAATEGEGRGWARPMLAGIIAALLADPMAGEEQALALARGRRERLPQGYADDEFLGLCADLAMAVVTLRREAEAPARAAGLPLVAWLNSARPGWRETLPLAVTGAGAEALVGELLAVEASAMTGAGVRAERLLLRGEDGQWLEAARLTLDGPVDGQVMREIDPDAGRLRVFAAGELARVMPGELAMLEPPGEGEHGWTARSAKRSRGVLPVPFVTAIECDLRAGEERVARVALPGGKARRGALLVCTVAAGSIDAPTALKVEGSGSGLFVADAVVLQVPIGWSVAALSDGEQVTALGAGVRGEGGDTLLWRVDGGATVTDSTGDCYRIRTGQTRDRRDRIEIDDHVVGWAQVEGDVDLFAGPPTVRPSDRTRGALFVRGIGERDWRPAPNPLPVGHYEIGWREGRTLLDRRRLAVLPRGATLRGTGRGREARWTLSGWEGAGWQDVALRPAPDAPVRVVDSEWHARPTARATHWFAATIVWQGAPPLGVRIAFPTEAAIAQWDGRLLPPDEEMTLADLGDLVAVSPGAMTMFGELVEAGNRRDPAVMRWAYCDELPMSSAAADIASMLLPASNDARVRLGMLDGIETYWTVRPFAVTLEKSANRLMAVRGVVAPDVEVCGRAFVEPAKEVSLGAYSLLSDSNHRPFGLPPGTRGDWIVYLREGASVVSRPQILAGDLPTSGQDSPLARAMALPPWEGLSQALDEVLTEAGRDSAAGERTVASLVSLAGSLRGLPPSSFEVLRLLPHHPAALTRMVLSAGDDAREAVLGLSDALPFAWCIVPKACWDEAGGHLIDKLLAAFATVDGGARYAWEAQATTISRVIEREPLLDAVLRPGTGAGSRGDAEMTFVRRVIDGAARGQSTTSRYRDRGLALPADHLDLPPQALEWLDTPYAAALAVAGAWTPRADDVRHIKTVARTFPTFFADAFAASLQELI